MNFDETFDLTAGVYFYFYNVQGLRMGAGAGTRSPGRAGQHFELFDSIVGKVKKVTTHYHSLRVQ